MKKEFRINFLKSWNFFLFCLFLYAQVSILMTLFKSSELWPMVLLFVLTMSLFQFASWYFSKIKVIVDDEYLTLVWPNGKRQQTRWSDINKIRRIFTIYAGYSYFVYYKDEIIGIPETIHNLDELLEIIEERSGQTIKEADGQITGLDVITKRWKKHRRR